MPVSGLPTLFEHQLAPDTVLKPLEPWHAEEFAAQMDRAREHIRPWVGTSFVTTGVEAARATLSKYAQATADDGARLVGIWLDGVLVGGVMFVAFDAQKRTAELGCWLEPGAQGQGLITRSCQFLLDWAFSTRGIHRIEWHCRASNARSAATAQRLGMSLEGTLRDSWQLESGFDDTQIWALLATDPKPSKT